MSEALSKLLGRAGRYRGEGINHDEQPFVGELTLEPVVDGKGAVIAFRATGTEDGVLYHAEHTVVAPGDGGTLTLVTLSSNSEGLLTLPLREHGPAGESEETLVFGVGVPGDEGTFRMEVAVDLWPGGDVSYRFSWGLPGGPFAPRSSVRMRPDRTDLSVPS